MTSLATRHSPPATRTITVAAIQTSYGTDLQANIDKTIALIRQAASQGAQETARFRQEARSAAALEQQVQLGRE